MGTTTDKQRALQILREYLGPGIDAPERQGVTEQMVLAMLEFGREKKINGAKSFAKLVRDMRQSQNRYFETRSDENLNKAKSLEAQVDAACSAVLESLK